MGLNPSKGNMYPHVTHTYNIIKGKCFHDCSYCYMKAINKNQKDEYIDTDEFKTDLTKDKYIFVGSSNDLFAENISRDWIRRSLDKCQEANNNLFGEGNKYLFQSKNPNRFLEFLDHSVFDSSVVCTTIETNRWYAEHMGKCPRIENRVKAMEKIAEKGFETHVTIEPIMDFDLDKLLPLVKRCKPVQVNIGSNSRWDEVQLPEPSKDKILDLIKELEKFTKVIQKENLKRLIG